MRARRAFVRGLALAPLASAAGAFALEDAHDASQASAEGAASAGEGLDGIEHAAGEVAARLRAIEARVPSARAFLASALRDHERLAGERGEIRLRLRLPRAVAAAPAATEAGTSLADLREAQYELVSSHVDALPALGDPVAVERLARHLTTFARHLTVIDLWIEAEEQRD